jgi:hypothetical protein
LKLRGKKKKKREEHNFSNILPLQSRFRERGPPFPFPIYSSSSSQTSSPLFKFDKTFEAIRKNDRDCKETSKRYNFRKPIREVGTSG